MTGRARIFAELRRAAAGTAPAQGRGIMNLQNLFFLSATSIVLALATGCAANTDSTTSADDQAASEDSELRGQRHFTCTAQYKDNGIADELTLRVSTLSASVTIGGPPVQRGKIDPSYEPRTNTGFYRYLVNPTDADSGYLLVQKSLLSGHPGVLKIRMDSDNGGGSEAYDCTP